MCINQLAWKMLFCHLCKSGFYCLHSTVYSSMSSAYELAWKTLFCHLCKIPKMSTAYNDIQMTGDIMSYASDAAQNGWSILCTMYIPISPTKINSQDYNNNRNKTFRKRRNSFSEVVEKSYLKLYLNIPEGDNSITRAA